MNQMKVIQGWGQYPKIQANVLTPKTRLELLEHLRMGPLICRGSGLSYGDSSLETNVLEMTNLKRINFDKTTGFVTCDSGARLVDILELVIPQGWFLPVTPGSSHITVGGAIAADVHGKNHFDCGTFSQFLITFDLLLGNGEIVTVSKTEIPELFHATCGGMGLTGIILTCQIKLKRIVSSNINQTALCLNTLEELVDAFQENSKQAYSVAWIDGLAKGKRLGQSILYLGNHADDNHLEFENLFQVNLPKIIPSSILNSFSLQTYNLLHSLRTSLTASQSKVSYSQYFYPLDRIKNWNRLYGKKGFIQYQFVIPEASALNGLKQVLNEVHHSGQHPYLAVLKRFGENNENLLSFPLKGYSLALDFKVSSDVFKLISRLDQMLLEHRGRVYLAKDALLSEHSFKSSYTKWTDFENIRHKYHAVGKFSSHQSKRLGLA